MCLFLANRILARGASPPRPFLCPKPLSGLGILSAYILIL